MLRVDSAVREEAAQLDGCYVIKTYLPHPNATKRGGVVLPNTKHCHAVNLFCNDVQMD